MQQQSFVDTAYPIAMRATVLEDVYAFSEGVMVSIYIFDGGEMPFGPCPWMPRGRDLPSKGDTALVIMDEEEEAWVIAWWPYDIEPPPVEPADAAVDTYFTGISDTDPGTIPPDEGNPTP
jgi:hypothetical protein